MVSGFGLGGFADGLNAGTKTAIQQQAEDRAAKSAQDAQIDKQITATMNHINEIFKAQADHGQTPDPNNKAITALLDSVAPLAQKIGRDPRQLYLMAGTMAQRPAAEDDTKHKIVQIGETTNGLNTTKKYGRLEEKSGAITPLGPDGNPVEAQPALAPSDVITPGQAQRANPPAAPPQAAPVAPQAANQPDAPVTQASFGQRFPADPQATPAQATPPAGPTLPAGMQPGPEAVDYAIKNNIVGAPFLDALPPVDRNVVSDVAEYKQPLGVASKNPRKGNPSLSQYQLSSMVHQYTNGAYDAKYYAPMQQAIKEFKSGGLTSPAGQITVGNTAISHAGQVADAIDKISAVPGLLDKIAKSDTPLISYAANALKNKSVIGTSEGEALSAFNTAAEHFADETTKFYAGGQPAEAGRVRALARFDAAKSPVELYSALNSESELMAGKVGALQDRWKNGLEGPPGYRNAPPEVRDKIVRNAIPDFPILSENSHSALDRVSKGYIKFKFKDGTTSGGNVQTGAPVDYKTYFQGAQ